MNITPVYSFDYWVIEAETEELGKVLLLDPNEDIPFPVTFETEEEAKLYIDEYKKKLNI